MVRAPGKSRKAAPMAALRPCTTPRSGRDEFRVLADLD